MKPTLIITLLGSDGDCHLTTSIGLNFGLSIELHNIVTLE